MLGKYWHTFALPLCVSLGIHFEAVAGDWARQILHQAQQSVSCVLTFIFWNGLNGSCAFHVATE